MAVALVAVLGAVPLAGAAGGDLDPSFGEAGKVVTPTGRLAFATAVAVQPDGRIVVGAHGADEPGATRGTLIRYLSDGSMDRSFGDRGTVVADEGGWVGAVALQRDGGIIVAVGDGIRRFLPDGAPDRGFGSGGTAPAAFAGGAYARLLVQPDGRVVVVGNAPSAAGGGEVRLVRLRRDGTPDPAFGQRGVVRTNANWHAHAAALAPDGKIVVAGQWVHPQKAHSRDGRPVELVVARYGPSGALDATFGRGGVARHRIDPADGVTTAVAVQRDGRIVVGGRGGRAATGSPRCCGAVWRLLPNGALDRSFGVGGQALTTTVPEPGRIGSRVYHVQALAVDRGGRVVVTALDEVSPGSRFGVARFTQDGRPDRRFGRDGAVTTSFGVAFARPWALALAPDGRIVLAGGAGAWWGAGGPSAIALARYLVPPCVVPNLRTRTRQGAAAALRNSGCALGRVTTAFSSDVARGRVISQQHRPLASLPEDSAVAIVLSRGSRR